MPFTEEELVEAGKMLDVMEKKARGSKVLLLLFLALSVFCGGAGIYFGKAVHQLFVDFLKPIERAIAASPTTIQGPLKNSATTSAPAREVAASQPSSPLTLEDVSLINVVSGVQLLLIAEFAAITLLYIWGMAHLLKEAIRLGVSDKPELLRIKILRTCLEEAGNVVPPSK